MLWPCHNSRKSRDPVARGEGLRIGAKNEHKGIQHKGAVASNQWCNSDTHVTQPEPILVTSILDTKRAPHDPVFGTTWPTEDRPRPPGAMLNSDATWSQHKPNLGRLGPILLLSKGPSKVTNSRRLSNSNMIHYSHDHANSMKYGGQVAHGKEFRRMEKANQSLVYPNVPWAIGRQTLAIKHE